MFYTGLDRPRLAWQSRIQFLGLHQASWWMLSVHSAKKKDLLKTGFNTVEQGCYSLTIAKKSRKKANIWGLQRELERAVEEILIFQKTNRYRTLSIFLTTSGSRSKSRNKSTENEETKALKYSHRGPKTRAPKIIKCRKDIALFQALY